MKQYKAPWDGLLVTLSSLLTALCLGITFLVFQQGGRAMWFGWLPLGLIVGCALFAIRGYTVTPDAILVRRLFWTTRLPRAGLQSAQFEPDAMRRSIRTFGNGGFFSYSGFYRSERLGSYRSLVTDRHQTVVLRYAGSTVVVSPALPVEFAHEVASRPVMS